MYNHGEFIYDYHYKSLHPDVFLLVLNILIFSDINGFYNLMDSF